jgi:hypothetical protein
LYARLSFFSNATKKEWQPKHTKRCCNIFVDTTYEFRVSFRWLELPADSSDVKDDNSRNIFS